MKTVINRWRNKRKSIKEDLKKVNSNGLRYQDDNFSPAFSSIHSVTDSDCSSDCNSDCSSDCSSDCGGGGDFSGGGSSGDF